MTYLRTAIINFTLLICTLSCSEKKDKITKTSGTLDAKTFEVLGESSNMHYKLPDTLNLKDTLKGYLIFKSKFDTINLNGNESHFINFYFSKTNSISKNYQEFTEQPHDTFVRIYDSIIPIYDITFNKTGSQLFEGYVVDYFYKDHTNDSIQLKIRKQHIMYRVFIK
ncbi:hypothetical protein [Cellulophaga baltica]|uniref:hypothetical protein n=1 Tax=Cellulophaga baltica TaxID=76594 RepID=UPI0024942078|nr:hypothetical protein [Cellulophaga baltica]